MHPVGTGGYRAAIVARTRFVEDLLVDEGIGQYVLLGAGLDTFAQRHAELAEQVQVFEIDQPGPQAWKRERLDALGYGVPRHLHLIPVDFEADDDWWQALLDAGFDPTARALVSSSGVSMYITKDATAATLRRLAAMAPGSLVAMTFMLPVELADEADRPGLLGAAARRAGFGDAVDQLLRTRRDRDDGPGGGLLRGPLGTDRRARRPLPRRPDRRPPPRHRRRHAPRPPLTFTLEVIPGGFRQV